MYIYILFLIYYILIYFYLLCYNLSSHRLLELETKKIGYDN